MWRWTSLSWASSHRRLPRWDRTTSGYFNLLGALRRPERNTQVREARIQAYSSFPPPSLLGLYSLGARAGWTSRRDDIRPQLRLVTRLE